MRDTQKSCRSCRTPLTAAQSQHVKHIHSTVTVSSHSSTESMSKLPYSPNSRTVTACQAHPQHSHSTITFTAQSQHRNHAEVAVHAAVVVARPSGHGHSGGVTPVREEQVCAVLALARVCRAEDDGDVGRLGGGNRGGDGRACRGRPAIPSIGGWWVGDGGW